MMPTSAVSLRCVRPACCPGLSARLAAARRTAYYGAGRGISPATVLACPGTR